MRSSLPTLNGDLFACDDAPTAAPSASDGGIEAGAEASQPADVSIEAFARRQADLLAAGIASAKAYWAAKGVTWEP